MVVDVMTRCTSLSRTISQQAHEFAAAGFVDDDSDNISKLQIVSPILQTPLSGHGISSINCDD